MLCLFMESSEPMVGSRQLPAGAAPGSRGKCLALRRAGRLQKHLPHTSQHVHLPLSHQSSHGALSRSYPAKSWYGILTSHLYAQLCCDRGTVASVRTRKPLAGGSWRSRLVPARARQDHSHACSAPRESGLGCVGWYS